MDPYLCNPPVATYCVHVVAYPIKASLHQKTTVSYTPLPSVVWNHPLLHNFAVESAACHRKASNIGPEPVCVMCAVCARGSGCVRAFVFTYTFVSTCTHKCVLTDLHTSRYVHIRTYIHACQPTYIHTCKHTYIHGRTHIYIYIHTHTTSLEPYCPELAAQSVEFDKDL